MEHENIIWQEYNKNAQSIPVNPLLARAISLTDKKEFALDIGCGAGKDTNLLAKHFRKVIALDSNNESEAYLYSANNNIEFICRRIEDYDFVPARFNLINAWNSLVFISPMHFHNIMKKIIDSLAKSGILAGNIFGTQDGWSTNPQMTFLSERSIKKLFANVDIISMEQVKERKKPIIGRDKRWHYYRFILKKKHD